MFFTVQVFQMIINYMIELSYLQLYPKYLSFISKNTKSTHARLCPWKYTEKHTFKKRSQEQLWSCYLDHWYNSKGGVWLNLDSGGDLILDVASECSGASELVLDGKCQSTGVITNCVRVDDFEHPDEHVLHAAHRTADQLQLVSTSTLFYHNITTADMQMN